MKLRRTLASSAVTSFVIGVTAVAVTACGDDESRVVTTVDAGNPLSPTDSFGSSASGTEAESTGATSVAEGTIVVPATTSASTEDGNASASTDGSEMSLGTDASNASTSASATTPVVGETSSEPPADVTTVVVEPCNIPSFSTFSRSDTDASWDDNDFSDVLIDSSQCPPGVFVDATWPHEAGWENGDPSEANQEQVHFTLDSYAANNLVDKEVTATIELVSDERGPNANAGGYLVSIVSVSTFDRITVIPPVIDPNAGPDASTPEPQTLTETGYSEAESDPKDRILLRRAGDRATISFRVPAKTEAVDSYDPSRVIKVNLRFYNVFEAPVVPVDPADAGVPSTVDVSSVETVVIDTSADETVGVLADASVDASDAPAELVNLVAPGGESGLVYGYLTSRFAITKFTITDVAPAAQ